MSYSDSDWARDMDDRKIITSFVFYIGYFNSIHIEFEEAIYSHIINL